jgi:DeoR/GlpR family transcriptional regulator of sugar metabolism
VAAPATREEGSSRLLARRRRDLIVELVERTGSVRVSELVDVLGVSDMTVRRDLDALSSEGAVRKVHGGATLPAGRTATIVEPGFVVKLSEQSSEKVAIARAAADMIVPGTAIGLTAGTTTWHLAKALVTAEHAVDDLVVVTNSIRICETLLAAGRSDLAVMLTGGVRTPSDALVGPLAEQALRGLHLDQLFMGVHGMTERTGFTTPNVLEAATNKAFAAAAAELVVVADHTKWGTVGLASIVPLAEAAAVVTDAAFDPALQAVIEGHGPEVVIAG